MGDSVQAGATLLGRYRLEAPLGQGGMGTVWAGVHTRTGRKVAIKFLDERFLTNTSVVERFGREARAASAVRHPGIVEVLDLDMTPDGVPFLVMERLLGETLTERIERSQKLTEVVATGIMTKLLEALDAAHAHGVIHRDLKPDNVFLVPGGRDGEVVKILDFGISHKLDEKVAGLTLEGSVLGTPHYMAPEQARGDLDIDARADLYAAGIVFYECVTGDVPFDAPNYNKLIQRILTLEPPPPEERGAKLSPPIRDLVLRTLSKNRNDRPNNAQEMLETLRRSRPTMSGPPSSMPPSQHTDVTGPPTGAQHPPAVVNTEDYTETRTSDAPDERLKSLKPPSAASAVEAVPTAPPEEELPSLSLGELKLDFESKPAAEPVARAIHSPSHPAVVDLAVQQAARDSFSAPAPESVPRRPLIELDPGVLRRSSKPPAPSADPFDRGGLDALDHGSRIELDEGVLRNSSPAPRAPIIRPHSMPSPDKAKSSWVKWVLMGLGAMVVLIVVIRLVVPADDQETTTPVVNNTAPVLDHTVVITVQGAPPGAVLRLDGLPMDGTEIRLRRGPSLHRMEIHAPGHESRTVEFDASEDHVVSGALEPVLRRPIQ